MTVGSELSSIAGTFQDALSSAQQPATLNHAGPSLVVTLANERKQLVAAEVTVSDRLGQIPRRLRWPSGEVFVTDDNDAIDDLLVALGHGDNSSWINRLESNLALALGSLVVVVAIYLFALLWGVPRGAAYLAHQIPASVGERAAEQSLKIMDGNLFKPSRLPHSRRENLRAQLLAVDPFATRIEFRRGDAVGANAMALPGGYIVITDELILLADSAEEVLAVYLHEVGHGKARHAETNILQDSAWLVILALATGDVNGVSELIFTLPVTLGQMAFSRDLELAADAYAIDALQRAGLSPELLATMLLKLEASALASAEVSGEIAVEEEVEMSDDNRSDRNNLLDYFSTHPATAERVARIRQVSNDG